MTGDYVSDLRAFCVEWLKQNQGCDLIDHGFGSEYGGELTTVKLAAVLDELEKLRTDKLNTDAFLMLAMHRYGSMTFSENDVRRATERWSAVQAQAETCPCGCPVVDDMCSCPVPCPCEPDCTFCLVPSPLRETAGDVGEQS